MEGTEKEVVKRNKGNPIPYHKFPSRIIVKSPFQKRINVSYGIVAYAWDTRKWLLVQHRYTLQFVNILRGSYRNSELPFLLQGLTTKELEQLRELTLDSFNFNSIFFRIFPQLCVEDEIYGKERFFANGTLFLGYKPSDNQPANPGWMFPKGFTRSKIENSVDCALRSFKEETGLEITRKEKSFFGRDPFCERDESETEAIGCLQQRYETRCWLAIFMKERPLPRESDMDEHSQKRWVSESEAMSLLDNKKQRILLEAKELIKENFLF